jgi:hypothetical protein
MAKQVVATVTHNRSSTLHDSTARAKVNELLSMDDDLMEELFTDALSRRQRREVNTAEY